MDPTRPANDNPSTQTSDASDTDAPKQGFLSSAAQTASNLGSMAYQTGANMAEDARNGRAANDYAAGADMTARSMGKEAMLFGLSAIEPVHEFFGLSKQAEIIRTLITSERRDYHNEQAAHQEKYDGHPWAQAGSLTVKAAASYAIGEVAVAGAIGSATVGTEILAGSAPVRYIGNAVSSAGETALAKSGAELASKTAEALSQAGTAATEAISSAPLGEKAIAAAQAAGKYAADNAASFGKEAYKGAASTGTLETMKKAGEDGDFSDALDAGYDGAKTGAAFSVAKKIVYSAAGAAVDKTGSALGNQAEKLADAAAKRFPNAAAAVRQTSEAFASAAQKAEPVAKALEIPAQLTKEAVARTAKSAVEKPFKDEMGAIINGQPQKSSIAHSVLPDEAAQSPLPAAPLNPAADPSYARAPLPDFDSARIAAFREMRCAPPPRISACSQAEPESAQGIAFGLNKNNLARMRSQNEQGSASPAPSAPALK